MTHRIKKSSITSNLEQPTCEKYVSRQLKKESKDSAKANQSSQKNKNRENMSKQHSYNTNLLNKNNRLVQENFPVINQKSCGNLPEYLEAKSSKNSPSRPRSKSAADHHQPWGQILKSEKHNDKSSIFGSFDPLRTLHFLVKELQFQLKTLLPDDDTLLQIVIDMQQALKRIPPEVASTVHIQQALNQLPNRFGSRTSLDIPERLKSTSEKGTQTKEEVDEEIHQIMIEKSLKLEASCRQMELLCINLKSEKENLERQFKFDKENLLFYKKRIEDLEHVNTNFNTKVKSLEKEKEELKLEQEKLKITHENQILTLENSLKSQISELKNSKTLIEQECSKLKHQLKLSTLEKEKNSAILTVRNRQISEMKNELLQLHEVISSGCLDFQKNAVKSLPKLEYVSKKSSKEQNKENIGDCSISTIYSDQHQVERPFTPQQNKQYRELPSADLDMSDNFSLHFPSAPPGKEIKQRRLCQKNEN